MIVDREPANVVYEGFGADKQQQLNSDLIE